MDAAQPESHRTLVFSRSAARAVDRCTIDEYGLPGIVLMENAARGVAAAAMRLAPAGRILVVCGTGNNGGDGWAAARHLANAGRDTVIITLGEPDPRSDAAINRRVVQRMGLSTMIAADSDALGPAVMLQRADLVIDAIFGTGLSRPIDPGPARTWIDAVNACGRPVLAVDLPSGLDADLGHPLGVAIRATRTVTFLGPKPGFLVPGAETWTGTWSVTDIGVPSDVLVRFGTAMPRRA